MAFTKLDTTAQNRTAKVASSVALFPPHFVVRWDRMSWLNIGEPDATGLVGT